MKDIAQTPITKGFAHLLASERQAKRSGDLQPPGTSALTRTSTNSTWPDTISLMNMAPHAAARPLFCSSTHAPGHPHCTCTHHHHHDVC
jgi:hypothetical protein